MRRALARGFTLVELLIVIALLGVIATIVIAAINPIEQANRASDAGMKADASQIVSAIQRYYASHNEFPWQAAASCTTNGGTGCTLTSDAEYPFISADNPSVGICGSATDCKGSTTQGELLAALELQNAFLSKSWIAATSLDAKIMVGKASGASSSVYVCWIPKSSSNRQKLISSAGTTSNKMVDITGFTSAGIPTSASASTCATPSDPNWALGKCYECVPE